MPDFDPDYYQNQILTARQIRFFQYLKDTRDCMLKAIAGLDEIVLITECVIGDWTIKDLLGHIVSWDDEFRADIKDILQGEHPGFMRRIDSKDEFNQWNQLQVSYKRLWTWQRILDDLDRDYREGCRLIYRLHPLDFRRRGVTPWKGAVVDEEDTDSVETLVTFHWRHTNEHTRQIEQWKKYRQRKPPSA